jgi:murein DD-endopeptidase MepM/ murein hydrolase activator NlpD
MQWAAAIAAIALAALPIRMAPPLDGLTVRDIHDSYSQTHNGHVHEAIDLLAPAGAPVHAVVRGTIRKLFLSKAGGNTIYEFDESATHVFYYAHLGRYAAGVQEGMAVEAGQVIAYVGSTGNADPRTPHLHFAVLELGPKREWWKGTPINPYRDLLDAVRRAKH